MYVWGNGSLAHMQGLHPDMVRVLKLAITLSEIDMTIAEGVRSDVQCFINFGKGRTVAECVKGGCPGKYSQPHLAKVTFLNHALSSNHRAVGGYGRAVDVYPYPIAAVLGMTNKEFEPLFDKVAHAMFAAAKQLGIRIRWGADWDLDNKPRERGETDNPHFELKG